MDEDGRGLVACLGPCSAPLCWKEQHKRTPLCSETRHPSRLCFEGKWSVTKRRGTRCITDLGGTNEPQRELKLGDDVSVSETRIAVSDVRERLRRDACSVSAVTRRCALRGACVFSHTVDFE